MDGIFRLRNRILEYEWGSRTAIAELLGRPSPAARPQAELWMGAHPLAPSTVERNGECVPLDRLIAADPAYVLGERVAARFGGQLPFLFKVLAAAEPLSVQVHPRAESAREGFARETAAGIPLDDDRRTYRDPNPKPELLCALAEFEALCGFRQPREIGRLLGEVAPRSLGRELARLEQQPDEGGLRGLVSALLGLPEERGRSLVAEAIKNAEVREDDEPACAWVCRLHRHYPDDAWIVAPLILNLIELKPGQALFTESGTLHSYLGGTGVELMASSDNVARAGLTPKRVDRSEVERLTRFEPSPVKILEATTVGPAELTFEAATSEFRLSRLVVGSDEPFSSRSALTSGARSVEVLLCIQGDAELVGEGGAREACRQGDSFLIAAGGRPYRIEGRAQLFRAQVPG